ncbi:MAG: polysaccharide deacetylase family protein [Actinomycetota bacterium]
MRSSTLIRKATKAAVLPLGVSSRRRAGDVVILLYHRVGMGDREIDLSVEAFEHQLIMLKERERVLSIDEALDGQGDGGVVLTFDDGYRDFYDHVLPLLVDHRVPGLLYLATSFVAGDGPGSAIPAHKALTWSQLQEAVGTGVVTCGSHTHAHADLSRATEAEAEEEMQRSKELIEDRLGVACRHFAYPWAVGSNGADRAARRLFDTAALHAWRTNRRGRTDPHRLGRVPILRSDGGLFFRAKVRGMLDGEALVYRILRRGPWGRI